MHTPRIKFVVGPVADAAALTDREIARAIAALQIEDAGRRPPGILPIESEHPDCVRLAFAWMAAQARTARPMQVRHPLKHRVEGWGGRYVSQGDVRVAAAMLGIHGVYPFFAISGDLVWPDESRLAGIGQALSQPGYRRINGSAGYEWQERIVRAMA